MYVFSRERELLHMLCITVHPNVTQEERSGVVRVSHLLRLACESCWVVAMVCFWKGGVSWHPGGDVTSSSRLQRHRAACHILFSVCKLFATFT